MYKRIYYKPIFFCLPLWRLVKWFFIPPSFLHPSIVLYFSSLYFFPSCRGIYYAKYYVSGGGGNDVVVVYHVTIVAIGHGLWKQFWPLVLGYLSSMRRTQPPTKKIRISSTIYVQLLQWLHGKQQQHEVIIFLNQCQDT